MRGQKKHYRSKLAAAGIAITKAAGIITTAATLSLFSGCGLIEREHMRLDISSLETIGAKRLGFTKGSTTVEQAKSAMKQSKMTGIIQDTFAKQNSPITDVLAADYQEELYLFRDGLFDGTIKLRTDGVPPYGFGLRVAESKGRIFLLALYRDPLDNVSANAGMPAVPPRIELFLKREDSWVPRGRMNLKNLTKRHGGLTDPLFVGSDLDFGITFLARSKAGTVWNQGYFLGLREEGGRERLAIVASEPLSKVAACSCVQDYIYGKAAASEEK